MSNKSWSDLIRDHKILMITIVVGFFLIEIEIFAVAVMKSGRQSWMNVLNDSGEIIYQVKGSTLTNFNKYYFENTFGSIEDYNVKLVSEDIPFPFRGWFAASIGIPVGLILLLAFILKAVMSLLYGKKSAIKDNEDSSKDIAVEEDDDNPNTDKADMKAHTKFGTAEGFGGILDQLSRLNIFIIGFLVLSAVILYLVIPNMLTFLAKVGIETLLNFKWFFIALFVGLFLLFAWFMYMKYQLAKKSMDAQTEIRKYEIKMEYEKFNAQAALEYNKREPKPELIGYSDVTYEEIDKEPSQNEPLDKVTENSNNDKK
ncbi:MAG: hypothetical protein HQK62_12515 [Desulfamplus sp.]|nr:hypothetical protein [Desulfamplus sp.]